VVERISRRVGRVARAVTAGRGYGQAAIERDLQELGVRTVAIPCQGTTLTARKKLEHSRSFHRPFEWRTGLRRADQLSQRSYGWDRTRLDGRRGAAIWCGHGVFAHNLVKIGALPADRQDKSPGPQLRHRITNVVTETTSASLAIT
jgi:transposase, IS5 family